MNYKDLMNEMYDFGKPKEKEVKKKKPTIKYTVSEDIRTTSYYENMTPLERFDLEKYIGEEIKLFEGVIEFNKVDSLANGAEIPSKYIMEKK